MTCMVVTGQGSEGIRGFGKCRDGFWEGLWAAPERLSCFPESTQNCATWLGCNRVPEPDLEPGGSEVPYQLGEAKRVYDNTRRADGASQIWQVAQSNSAPSSAMKDLLRDLRAGERPP